MSPLSIKAFTKSKEIKMKTTSNKKRLL